MENIIQGPSKKFVRDKTKYVIGDQVVANINRQELANGEQVSLDARKKRQAYVP